MWSLAQQVDDKISLVVISANQQRPIRTRMWQPQPTQRNVSLSGRLRLAFLHTTRFIHWSRLASAAFAISTPSGPVHAL